MYNQDDDKDQQVGRKRSHTMNIKKEMQFNKRKNSMYLKLKNDRDEIIEEVTPKTIEESFDEVLLLEPEGANQACIIIWRVQD